MKIKRLNENSNTRLKKALFGDASGKIKTFAVMTPENPDAKTIPAEKNNKLLALFKVYLKQMHIQYIPIEGSFGAKEHSFMLFNLSLEDAKFLAKKFGQLSFFYGNTKTVEETSKERNTLSDIGYYEKRKDKYELIDTVNKVVDATDFEDFFSRHGNFKYNFDLDYFKESLENIKDIKDTKSLKESLDDSYTLKHRFHCRALAYNGKKAR